MYTNKQSGAVLLQHAEWINVICLRSNSLFLEFISYPCAFRKPYSKAFFVCKNGY